MLVIKNNRIYITRGDTGTIQITFQTADMMPSPIGFDDVITMTVKKLASDTEPLIQIQADASGQFSIAPEDTQNLSAGIYLYDVQLVRDGNIYTVVPQNYFEIKEEITG